MSRMGQALHYLENNLSEFSNSDSFYQLESLLFIMKAETFKESACFEDVAELISRKNFQSE